MVKRNEIRALIGFHRPHFPTLDLPTRFAHSNETWGQNEIYAGNGPFRTNAEFNSTCSFPRVKSKKNIFNVKHLTGNLKLFENYSIPFES